jgi:hypothetical protein
VSDFKCRPCPCERKPARCNHRAVVSRVSVLIAVALDDHLAIRFPLTFPDDRCFAAALALLDYGRLFAISVAVIRPTVTRLQPAHLTPTPTSSALAGTAAHMLAAAIIANTCLVNRSWRCLHSRLNPMHQLSFRLDRSGDRIAPHARNPDARLSVGAPRNPEDIAWTGIVLKWNWKEVKGKVKEKWETDDDDLTAIDGQRATSLEGRLQQRYG